MEKLSVTIISLNEEKKIGKALESVKWADEIIVVDSGSSDKTLEICKKYTDKVFHNDWPGYAAQKNFATDKANHDWILSIDADEEVTPELAFEIKETLKAPQAPAYALPRHVFYLGRWINFSGWYPDHKVRLFHRDKAKWTGNHVHETVEVSGSVKYLLSDLNHYTFDTVEDHINTMNKYTSLETGSDKKSGYFEILFRPPFAFFKSYILKQGFRDGFPGLIIGLTTACHVFLKYTKLWEKNNVKNMDVKSKN